MFRDKRRIRNIAKIMYTKIYVNTARISRNNKIFLRFTVHLMLKKKWRIEIKMYLVKKLSHVEYSRSSIYTCVFRK